MRLRTAFWKGCLLHEACFLGIYYESAAVLGTPRGQGISSNSSLCGVVAMGSLLSKLEMETGTGDAIW